VDEVDIADVWTTDVLDDASVDIALGGRWPMEVGEGVGVRGIAVVTASCSVGKGSDAVAI
jgi:hypothetical protein